MPDQILLIALILVALGAGGLYALWLLWCRTKKVFGVSDQEMPPHLKWVTMVLGLTISAQTFGVAIALVV